MTISAAGGVRNINTGVTAHTVVLSNVAEHETVVVGFIDRTGGAVINSVTDSASGTYTQRSTHTAGTALQRIYVREDCAAAASLTITVTTNVSQNSQMIAARVASDAGGTVYPTFDVAATSLQVGSPDTIEWDSNTAAATAAGAIVGLIGTNATQTGNPTMNGAGESNLVATGAGVRSFLFFEAYASSGSYGFDVTLSDAANGGFQVIALKESVASTTVTPSQAALTLNGRTPVTSAFQNVRIREVLVNGSGQAVGSATSIGLRVWYSGICAGAPDVSLNGMTTDADGTTSWSIATGTLAFNDPIFFVAQNSVSYSHYACGRLVPNYE